MRGSISVLIIIAVGLILSAIAIPILHSSNRASRERMASMAIKTLSLAESDFRANDRDRNHVNDFWTGDVSGLYYVKPVDGGTEVRLIEVDVAGADARPIHPLPLGSGPRKGYRFQALDQDDSVEGEKGVYRVDTDRSGHKVHNIAMFGFVAFPADGGEGRLVFVLNENNTVFAFPGIQFRATWPAGAELLKLSHCRDDED